MNIKNTLLAIALLTFSSASIAYDNLIGYSERHNNIAEQLANQDYQMELQRNKDSVDREEARYYERQQKRQMMEIEKRGY